MKKNNKGFSLVELIVVVLILGILAVAVTPQIMGWVNKSNIAKDESYAGTVATAVESVALEYIGKGWTASIPAKIDIEATSSTNDTPVMKGYTAAAPSTDVNVPATEPTVAAGAKPTVDNFMFDLNEMIGDGKLALPGQTGRAKYTVLVTVNSTTGTVNIEAEATN